MMNLVVFSMNLVVFGLNLVVLGMNLVVLGMNLTTCSHNYFLSIARRKLRGVITYARVVRTLGGAEEDG